MGKIETSDYAPNPNPRLESSLIAPDVLRKALIESVSFRYVTAVISGALPEVRKQTLEGLSRDDLDSCRLRSQELLAIWYKQSKATIR